MPKIKIKTTATLLFMLVVACAPLTGLIVRFSLYTKKITLPNGTAKVQRVVLCGDNHVIGTPKNNLHQWCNLLEQLKNYHDAKIDILVENQQLASHWFNDEIDQKLQHILHQDLI